MKAENLRLKEKLRAAIEPKEEGPLADKLRADNEVLAEAVKKLRSEAEDLRRREAEAAEQVTKATTTVIKGLLGGKCNDT